jgi:hypothetical protein
MTLRLYPHVRGVSVALALSVLAASLPAQIPGSARDPNHRFPVADLQADFTLLRSALEEAHAGLYRYSPKPAMDRMFDEAAARLRTPMTEWEFLTVVSTVVAGVHDGHTGVGPSEALTAHLDGQPILLPFGLRFLNGRAYLYQDFTDTPTVAMGAEVTSLNGMAIGHVVARLLPRIPADGRGTTGKFRRVLDRPSSFSRLYALEFGATNSFTLTYAPPGADRSPRTITVGGITMATLEERGAERYPGWGERKPPIALTWQGAVPVLTVRTFAARESTTRSSS